MERIERTLLSLVVTVSAWLDPVASLIGRLHVAARQQMTALHVPAAWQPGLVAAAWVVVLFMLLRTAPGWLRLALLVATGFMVAKLHGVLPVR